MTDNNLILQNDKIQLRNNASKIGILLLTYHLVILKYVKYLFFYLYYLIYNGNMPASVPVLNDFLTSHSNNTLFRMQMSSFCVFFAVLVFVIFARLLGVKIIQLLKPDKKALKFGVFAYPVCMIFNTIITTSISLIITLLKTKNVTVPTADFTVDSPTFSAIFFSVLYLLVIAPIAEEIMFRGLILKTIAPFGKTLAIVLSSLLFGLMHGNIQQFFGAFVIGIMFAVIDIKCGSIIPSIIAHSFNNLIPTLNYINVNVNSTTFSITIKVITFVVCLSGFLILLSKGTELFFVKDNDNDYTLTKSTRIKTIYFNVFIIGAIAYFAYVMIRAIIVAN